MVFTHGIMEDELFQGLNIFIQCGGHEEGLVYLG